MVHQKQQKAISGSVIRDMEADHGG